MFEGNCLKGKDKIAFPLMPPKTHMPPSFTLTMYDFFMGLNIPVESIAPLRSDVNQF